MKLKKILKLSLGLFFALPITIFFEKELLANERKAAQASIAAYKDMEESLNMKHQRDSSLISMKDGELEKLRIALAKARDGLRLASERSLSLETKMKSPINRLGFIEPDGILKGSAMKDLINNAIKIANSIDLIFEKNLFLFFMFKY